MTSAELLETLRSTVRGAVKKEYSNSDLFDPDLNLGSLTNIRLIKAWTLVGISACQDRSKESDAKKLLNSDIDKLERTGKAFRKIEEWVRSGNFLAAQEAVKNFDEWRKYDGYEDWEFFAERQRPVSSEAKTVVEAQAKLAEHDKFKQQAIDIAVRERKRYRNGPNGNVGTVIAGLVDSISGKSWIGTSGGAVSHSVVAQVLSHSRQVEEWEVAVCGEVHALHDYIVDQGIESRRDIKPGTLYSHAETWVKPKQKDKKGEWQSRSACKNCEAWLKAIGAHMA